MYGQFKQVLPTVIYSNCCISLQRWRVIRSERNVLWQHTYCFGEGITDLRRVKESVSDQDLAPPDKTNLWIGALTSKPFVKKPKTSGK